MGAILRILDENGQWVGVDAMLGPPGPSGDGSGDMVASMYDPQAYRRDVFGYVNERTNKMVSSFNGRSGEVTPQEGDYTAAQVGAVSTNGGIMTGYLRFVDDDTKSEGRVSHKGHETIISAFNITGNADNYRFLQFGDSNSMEIKACLRILDKTDGIFTTYNVLHTGNKPSGSYTGNGDATARKIETGGIGNACLVWGNGYCAIVEPNGALYFGNTGNTADIPKAEMNFTNGVLAIATTNSFNKSGVTYNYQVL